MKKLAWLVTRLQRPVRASAWYDVLVAPLHDGDSGAIQRDVSIPPSRVDQCRLDVLMEMVHQDEQIAMLEK